MPKRPVIAVTSGEPAGVGPDICLRLSDRAGQYLPAHLVLLADRELMAERAQALYADGESKGARPVLRDWTPELLPDAGSLDILHVPLAVAARPGRLDPANSP